MIANRRKLNINQIKIFMKKYLLSLVAVLGFGCFASHAEDTTITATQVVNNATADTDLEGKTWTAGSYEFTFAKNNGTTAPKYYLNGTDVRMYAKNTMVVKGTGMTKLVFTLSNTAQLGEVKARVGTMTPNITTESGKTSTYTWTGTAVNEITFTVGDKATLATDENKKEKNGQFRWNQVVISGEKDETISQSPVISPASGSIVDPQNGLTVTITAAAGAKIYYTTDGNDPTTSSDEYVNEIVLMHAATVKAIAVEEGKKASPVVTAVYKEPAATVANIKAFIDKADTENVVVISGPVVVSGEFTYSSGQSLYVQDETGYLLIFDKNKKLPAYEVGDRISNFAGTYSVYNQAAQMVPDVATFGAGVAGDAPEAKVITVTEPTLEQQNMYVKLVNVGIETSATNEKDHYAVVGNDKILLFNRFSINFPADATEGYDVYGYVGAYFPKEGDPTIQIFPAVISETGKEPEKFEAATIAEFLEKAKDDATNVWTITGDVKTVYQNGSNLYVQDVEAPYTGMLVFGTLGHEYEAGTLLKGIKGKWTNYYSTIEFTATASSFTEGVKGSEPVYTVMDVENVTADNQNLYVEFEKVKVSGYDATTKTFTLTDVKDATFQGYNKWDKSITVPADDKEYNVFGFISYYQAKGDSAPKLQFYPISFVDAAGVEGVALDKNVPAEYYTIDGVRVAQPENGIYIVRQGDKVYKMIIRK